MCNISHTWERHCSCYYFFCIFILIVLYIDIFFIIYYWLLNNLVLELTIIGCKEFPCQLRCIWDTYIYLHLQHRALTYIYIYCDHTFLCPSKRSREKKEKNQQSNFLWPVREQPAVRQTPIAQSQGKKNNSNRFRSSVEHVQCLKEGGFSFIVVL